MTSEVGNIGPLHWDKDPYVRYAAAFALDGTTGKDLLLAGARLTPDLLAPQSILADTQERKIVRDARTWWTADGSEVNWHPAYDICDL